MAAAQEVHSFVTKFLNLCKSGKNADLSLKCKDGKTVINLQLDLESYPSDVSTCIPPPPYPPRQIYPRPSPYRMRRSARRARARADAAENIAVILSPEAEIVPTEQVEASIPLTKESVLKDVHHVTTNFNTDQENETAQHGEQVSAEKDVGEEVHNENHDATTLDEKTTSSTEEELTKPKLLNDLTRDEFFTILENELGNFSLNLSKPP